MNEPENGKRPAERVVLITAALGSMLAPLNSMMIVVALPQILDDFGRSLTWGSWIVVSYLVAMAAVQPLGGSLGDRYGRNRLFMFGLVGFAFATILAALAPSIEILIIARTIQAIAGAIAIPNGTALVRELIHSDRQGRAFGLIGAGVGVAAALGPPLGGVITDQLSWRWIFAANLVLIIPAIVLVLRLPSSERALIGRFNLRGACLLTVALISLALSLTVWQLEGVPLATAPLFAVVAVATGLALRRSERSSQQPILNFGLFQRRGYLPASMVVLLSNMTMYTILLSLPVFLTMREGWSSSQVGLVLVAMSIQMIVLSPAGGWLSDRFGRRLPAVTGTALMAGGVIPFIAIDPAWSWEIYLVPLALVGTGLGLSSAPVQAAAMQAAASDETGQAAGLFSTMRYLGSITGSGMMAAVLVGVVPEVSQFRLLYVLLFLAALGATLSATRLPGITTTEIPASTTLASPSQANARKQ